MHKKISSIILSVLILGTSFQNVLAKSPTESPEFINNSIVVTDSQSYSTDFNGAMDYLKNNANIFNIEDPANKLQKTDIIIDNLGYTHIKLQQVYEGIPVYGQQYIVHYNTKNEIYATNGKFDNSVYLDNLTQYNPKNFINKDDAISLAMKEVEAEYVDYDPEVQLYIYEFEGQYYYAYKVRLIFMNPYIADYSVFINAVDGTTINKFNRLATAVNTTGTGTGVLGEQRQLEIQQDGTNYVLVDNTNGGAQIMTYDAGNKTFFPQFFLPGTLYSNTTNTFSAQRDKAAVDAHYFAGLVYDYYKNNFNRNSLDGRGMNIVSSVHFDKNYVNAFWNGRQMAYGDGDGVKSIEICGALDVVGHELTHGVIEFTAGLDYQNQSGALNESFADVFGTLIEFEYQQNKADFLCGEDVWTPNTPGDALRSLENPGLYNQPAHMNNYVNTSQDNGGVHINSGIPNKAAYLIISDIGPEKSGQIYYRALSIYLTNTSQFIDCKNALLQSATDLYGHNSPEYTAILNAFNSVGI